jgi:hypothetical protein
MPSVHCHHRWGAVPFAAYPIRCVRCARSRGHSSLVGNGMYAPTHVLETVCQTSCVQTQGFRSLRSMATCSARVASFEHLHDRAAGPATSVHNTCATSTHMYSCNCSSLISMVRAMVSWAMGRGFEPRVVCFVRVVLLSQFETLCLASQYTQRFEKMLPPMGAREHRPMQQQK